MATVDEGLRSQVRNIEATYGRSMADWAEVVRASGLTRHGEIVALLKRDYAMPHGAANRTALVVLDLLSSGQEGGGAEADPISQLYSGKKASLRPLHDALMARVNALGSVEVAPKKGYLSLRRRTQFGMIQPAAAHLDLGLNLKSRPTTERFTSAATFNALFTHRVRIRDAADLDPELDGWLGDAYEEAK